MLRRRVRWLLIWVFAFLFVIVALIARPALHLWRTLRGDIGEITPLAVGFTNDASRLNLTSVREVKTISSDMQAAEGELRAVLSDAAAKGFKVAIAGARHSMGGQTIYPDGIVINMLPLAAMELDGQVLRVSSGAIWSDVLTFLDAKGRSIAVMQSNDSFTIGGSISVNCHGWQVGKPPIASTVQAFRLMLADGSIVRCSREENGELFSAVLGGYGLFGFILDVDLLTVPNRLYRIDRRVIPSEQLPATWEEMIAAHSMRRRWRMVDWTLRRVIS